MADESIGLRLNIENDAQYISSLKRSAEATHQLDTSMQSVGRNSGRFGLAVNAMAQGLEDLQYSVGGAMNNLSQVAMLMGAGGMVIAGVTLTGVAVNQLARHWDDLAKLWRSGETETEAERMERLAKSTNRLATETAALSRYQSDQARIREIESERSPAEKQQMAAVRGAFAEFPAAAVADEINRKRREKGVGSGLTVAEERELAQLREDYARAAMNPLAGLDRGKMSARIEELNKKSKDTGIATADIVRAESDPKALARLVAEMQQLGVNPQMIMSLQRIGNPDFDRDTRHMIARGEAAASMEEARSKQKDFNKALDDYSGLLAEANKKPFFQRGENLDVIEDRFAHQVKQLGDLTDLPREVGTTLKETIEKFREKLLEARQKIDEEDLASIAKNGKAAVSPMAAQAEYEQAQFGQQQRYQNLARAIFNYQMASADTGGAAGVMQRQMLARFGYGVGMGGGAMSTMQRQFMRRFGPRPMNDKQAEAFWQMQQAAKEWQDGVSEFKQVMENVRIVL